MSIDVRNILLANDDLTVIGPPSTVEVLVDIGPPGTRGSQFFVGSGNPNLINIGQTPLINDLFLNISPGAEIGYIYQYRSQPGGNTWVRVLDIFPTMYSINYEVPFVDGVGSAIIPVNNIVQTTGTPLSAENFSVQYSIAHDKPVSSAMAIPALLGEGNNLVINFEAIEYSGGTWSNLDEEVAVHILITIVP
jgi:hypothetical protein